MVISWAGDGADWPPYWVKALPCEYEYGAGMGWDPNELKDLTETAAAGPEDNPLNANGTAVDWDPIANGAGVDWE